MIEVTEKQALDYHRLPRPGKIEVIPTKPYSTQRDLAMAYTPGVAYPCLAIQNDPQLSYDFTNRSNLVAVISNGTATLGLGDIGALASKPVMEGKALLFKIFAGIDTFDIEVDTRDPQRLVDTIRAIAPTFGAINLEDIKAPECFTVERQLVEQLDIPVMHDDQHGTAIITAAAMLNALILQGKEIGDVRMVVNGAGAAAVACTDLLVTLGLKPENIVMCDSRGAITTSRTDINEQKRRFATSRPVATLADALAGADIFLGLSVKNILTPGMLRTMAPRPIVFALANPDPEIPYDEAIASRDDIIFATGRSDYPNQINNVLGFPYIFRGALDTRASAITLPMKLAAVHAIAALARKPAPLSVRQAYPKGENFDFGPTYILPKPMDPRLLLEVAPAVAQAAISSGVARRPIADLQCYSEALGEMIEREGRLTAILQNEARRHGNHPTPGTC